MAGTKARTKLIEVPCEQPAERNGAFAAIFCRAVRPYVNYDRPIDCPRDQPFPALLMQMRWDGLFGFPGGKVDPGETLRQACVRECREELGVAIEEAQLVPVCTHMERKGNFAAHLYAVEVDEEGLHAAVRSSWTAQDAEAEVCGVIVPRISLHGVDQGKGILQFYRNAPMSFSARNEFILVLERLGLLNDEEMKLFRTGIRSRKGRQCRSSKK